MPGLGDLRASIRRRWREYAAEEAKKNGEAVPDDFQLSQPGDGDLTPPDAKRVARRAAVLAAVALRGMASQWETADEEHMINNLRGWLNVCDEPAGLLGEIEGFEAHVFNAGPGELSPENAAQATWRWEGVTVLVWSLGRFDLPPYDQQSDPQPVGDAAGLLQMPDQVAELIETAAFAPGFNAEKFARHNTTLHWRLTDHVHGEQRHMDFASFAEGVDWIDMTLDRIRLKDGDIEIGGHAINDAPPELFQSVRSITAERHHAANWLAGWDESYEAVETPT